MKHIQDEKKGYHEAHLTKDFSFSLISYGKSYKIA